MNLCHGLMLHEMSQIQTCESLCRAGEECTVVQCNVLQSVVQCTMECNAVYFRISDCRVCCSAVHCTVHCLELGRWESLACHGTASVMIQLADFLKGAGWRVGLYYGDWTLSFC